MTKLEDALAAVAAGVDALGFIFHEKSPRSVDPETVRLIIEQLPPFVNTVGVFVNRDCGEVEEIIRFCGLSCTQLHGQEPPDYCEQLSPRRCALSDHQGPARGAATARRGRGPVSCSRPGLSSRHLPQRAGRRHWPDL